MSLRGTPIPRSAVSSLRGSKTEAMESLYLLGESPAMHRLRSQLQRIGPYFRTALVTGEEGTGKETVARALHALSPAADGPFVAWSAAKYAERLSPDSERIGLMQEAYRGTLYLQEIASVPLFRQLALLRVLQQQELRSQRCDVRIVVSSTRELRTLATTGQFREELYRQVASVDIALTPLRKRPEDIACVAEIALRRMNTARISAEALARLEAYRWPGNVREFEAALERAAILAEYGTVEARHLALVEPKAEAAPEPSLERLQDVVQRHVLQVLTKCAGNKLRAAEVLGISRSTLYRMLDACAPGVEASYSAKTSSPQGERIELKPFLL